MSMRPTLWISMKPLYADAILDGSKSYELRRIAPSVAPGSLVVLYASAPRKAVVGAFRLEKIIREPVESLWHVVRGCASVDHETYQEYFHGAELGTALSVGACWNAAEDIDLTQLRTAWPGFHPPQSYRYMSSENQRHDVDVRLLGGPALRFSPRGVARSAGTASSSQRRHPLES